MQPALCVYSMPPLMPGFQQLHSMPTLYVVYKPTEEKFVEKM